MTLCSIQGLSHLVFQSALPIPERLLPPPGLRNPGTITLHTHTLPRYLSPECTAQTLSVVRSLHSLSSRFGFCSHSYSSDSGCPVNNLAHILLLLFPSCQHLFIILFTFVKFAPTPFLFFRHYCTKKIQSFTHTNNHRGHKRLYL